MPSSRHGRHGLRTPGCQNWGLGSQTEQHCEPKVLALRERSVVHFLSSPADNKRMQISRRLNTGNERRAHHINTVMGCPIMAAARGAGSAAGSTGAGGAQTAVHSSLMYGKCTRTPVRSQELLTRTEQQLLRRDLMDAATQNQLCTTYSFSSLLRVLIILQTKEKERKLHARKSGSDVAAWGYLRGSIANTWQGIVQAHQTAIEQIPQQ